MKDAYTIKVDSEIKAEFQDKFSGEAGAEIEKLMRARLKAKNSTEAETKISSQSMDEEESAYEGMLKDAGLYEYYKRNLAIHSNLRPQAYYEYHQLTGSYLYKVRK